MRQWDDWVKACPLNPTIWSLFQLHRKKITVSQISTLLVKPIASTTSSSAFILIYRCLVGWAQWKCVASCQLHFFLCFFLVFVGHGGGFFTVMKPFGSQGGQCLARDLTAPPKIRESRANIRTCLPLLACVRDRKTVCNTNPDTGVSNYCTNRHFIVKPHHSHQNTQIWVKLSSPFIRVFYTDCIRCNFYIKPSLSNVKRTNKQTRRFSCLQTINAGIAMATLVCQLWFILPAAVPAAGHIVKTWPWPGHRWRYKGSEVDQRSSCGSAGLTLEPTVMEVNHKKEAQGFFFFIGGVFWKRGRGQHVTAGEKSKMIKILYRSHF